ncbi:MAG: LysE family translocator [Polaromonas sp.]|jgi:threonine/homoserine/homoserine lactone efflux protein|nr:LysE family translocator [Polaromonas sp.]
MGIDHLALFVAAGIVLNLTPGPDVLFIVTNALRSGARAGMVAALGITAGCFVHILAAAIGVSALMAASATAFTLLKWAGAAYLVVVGLRMLLASAPTQGGPIAMDPVAACADGESAKALKRVFFQGFWTNALNPKVALFFLAFVPQFIAPGAEHKALAFLLLGLLFNANALWINLGWAGAAAWMAGRMASAQGVMHWLERAAGLMFIGFGLRLAFSDRPAT